jgi:glucosamine-6-phosphate deaminase
VDIKVFPTKTEMAASAARQAADALRRALHARGKAHVIAATGASQFEFLDGLVKAPGIDWSRTVFFHLDEYVGLPATHPASFRRYLREHLIDPTGMTRVHLLDVDADPAGTAVRVGQALLERPVDLACVGIGENGHLAFNDPPADFDTTEPYIIVSLDRACRAQQVGEGWFATIEEVPDRAVSMSIRQILAAREIVAVVPDERKAAAVQGAVEGAISPLVPASALRLHSRVTLYLDDAAASRLHPDTRARSRSEA